MNLEKDFFDQFYDLAKLKEIIRTIKNLKNKEN